MWIRVDVGLARHRKTRKLSARLGLDLTATVGALVSFWSEVRLQEPDGSLRGWDAEDVSIAMGLSPYKIGFESALSAMKDAGFIREEDGNLVVHEWFEHNGDHIKEALKKRANRASKSGRPGDVPGTAADVPGISVRRDVTVRDVTVRDEESKIAPPAPSARPDSESDTTAEPPRPTQANGTAPSCHSELELGSEHVPDPASAPEPILSDRRAEVIDLLRGTASALRMPARISGKLDVARVAKLAEGTGREVTRTAIQLAQRWWNSGCRSQVLIDLRLGVYLERRESIGNPFAYFNGPKLAEIDASASARREELEHEARMALDRQFAAEVKG